MYNSGHVDAIDDIEQWTGQTRVAPGGLVAFRHEPLGEVVQPLLLVFVAVALYLVACAAALEPLLACVEGCFDTTAGEESAVHFLVKSSQFPTPHLEIIL